MPAEVIITDVEEKQDKQETPASKPAIGIIYPPPEVRNIVDKTGGFVARNGPEFEARIRQNEINNPKFNFLNPGDPYHAYYQHKVREFKEGKPGPEPAQVPALQKAQATAELRRATEILKSIEQPLIPKEPPPEPEFIADPPSISALDLDLVRLTAQFAARNGRQFLTTLVNREQHNYQFHFLKPHHSLFQYFTKLLKQYTKILIPPKDLMNKLKKESTDPKIVLDQVRYRVEWTRLQETQRRKEEEAVERERVAYAQIDWHDFLVVETVDYQQNEQGHFPPPTTPDEVGNRVLQQERLDEMGQEEMEVESESDQEEDEEENENKDKDDRKKPKKKVVAKPPAGAIMAKDADEESLPSTASSPSSPSSPSANSDSEEEEEEDKRPPTPPPPPPESIPQPPPLPPNPDQVVVRKDYDPKAQKTVRPHLPDDFLVSPLTGERIPASKVQEHMRIGLLDPRWVEQRDRFNQERAEQEEVYAAGSAIESSLKELAQRRTDIFGTEETAIGRKIGEEDQKPAEKVTWDGHTASMEAATRAARANITIEEQIHQIHKVKGLLPDEEKERIGPSKPTTSSGAPMKQPPLPPTPAAPKPQPPPPPVPAPIPVIRHPPPPPMHAPLPPLPPMGMIMVQPQPPVPMGPPVGMRMMGIPQPPMHHSHLPPMPPGTSFQPLPPGAPPGMHPPLPGNPPPPPGARPPQTRPAEDFDGPPNKKLKTEESLIPEDEFLKKNKSPTVFKVACPNAPDKPEWKLIGQMMTLTMPLTDPISVIKAKIHEQTNMPPGKQKLQYEGMFVKDSNTLAFYNLTPGSIIHLQLKERGGRKK